MISNNLIGLSYVSVMLTVLGAIALVFSAVGIYGLMAYSVTARTHEIGIRLALGAARQDILRMLAPARGGLDRYWSRDWAGHLDPAGTGALQPDLRRRRKRPRYVWRDLAAAGWGCVARLLCAGATGYVGRPDSCVAAGITGA